MKKYKTSEAIAMLEQNPELRFNLINKDIDYVITANSKGVLVTEQGYNVTTIVLTDEWELVQQPVSFMEAVKAYSEGKTIRCEESGSTNTYTPPAPKISNMLKSTKGWYPTTDEILNGIWYVEE